MQQRVKRWQDGGDILSSASIGTNSRRCMQQRLERWQDGGDILSSASIDANSGGLYLSHDARQLLCAGAAALRALACVEHPW